jgi:hypothetical protein
VDLDFEFPHLFCVVGLNFKDLININQMAKPMDPMWEYGEPYEGHNRTKLSCKLCGKGMYGGINRLQYHLAKIQGDEVEVFPLVTPDVVLIAKNLILDIIGMKNQREELRNHKGTTSYSGVGET